MSTLAGKVALISGSSLGIGAAIARELYRNGASVAINYPDPSDKANADKVLQGFDNPHRAIAIEADLSTLEGPRALAEAAAKAFGKIDILVNSAGINRQVLLDDPDDAKVEAAWHDTANLNGRGVFLLTRAVLKHLSREHSRIINIGSTATQAPSPAGSAYGGSKAMMHYYTQCWAAELAPKYGCTVNAVAPGPVGTETFYATPSFILEALQPVIDSTPAGKRVGKPDEVAWLVARLCQEEAGWINGAYIPINGGARMF